MIMPLQQPEIEHFMNQARIKLPGASDAGIKTELYETVREFLQDTNAWVEHMSLPVTQGQQEYNLIPKKGGQIIRLVGAWDGNRIPVNCSMPEFGKLLVYRPPQMTSIVPVTPVTTLSATNPWLVVVYKNVTLPTTRDDFPVVPDFVLRVYETYILDGVLGRMMTQQAKSYTNTTLGTYHLKRFRDGIAIARSAAKAQNLVGGQTWAFPRGWQSSSQRGGVSTPYPLETF